AHQVGKLITEVVIGASVHGEFTGDEVKGVDFKAQLCTYIVKVAFIRTESILIEHGRLLPFRNPAAPENRRRISVFVYPAIGGDAQLTFLYGQRPRPTRATCRKRMPVVQTSVVSGINVFLGDDVDQARQSFAVVLRRRRSDHL